MNGNNRNKSEQKQSDQEKKEERDWVNEIITIVFLH